MTRRCSSIGFSRPRSRVVRESSAAIRVRVEAARERQRARFNGRNGEQKRCNTGRNRIYDNLPVYDMEKRTPGYLMGQIYLLIR